MKTTFALIENNLTELGSSELIEVSGGHNGLAYKIGHAFGEGVRKVGEVVAIAALVGAYFLTPKS